MYYNTNYNIIQREVIMALTTADIHAAADKLHAEGITPTQTKVREALGGGSFSTIGEALKTWKQELQEHEQLKKTDMPDAIKEEGLVFVAKLWQTADQIANANLSADREAHAIENAKKQAALDDANEAIATLEAEYSEMVVLLELTNQEAQRADSEAEESAKEIISLNTFITDLNHKLDIEKERTASATASLTATNDKLDSTRTQLDATNDQLTQARESIASYTATNSAQSADIERLQADAIEHRQAYQTITDKLTERTAERDDLAKQLAALQGKLEAVTEQSKQLVAERDSAVTDNKELAASNAALSATKERMLDDMTHITIERNNAMSSNQVLQDEIAKLKAANKPRS